MTNMLAELGLFTIGSLLALNFDFLVFVGFHVRCLGPCSPCRAMFASKFRFCRVSLSVHHKTRKNHERKD